MNNQRVGTLVIAVVIGFSVAPVSGYAKSSASDIVSRSAHQQNHRLVRGFCKKTGKVCEVHLKAAWAARNAVKRSLRR